LPRNVCDLEIAKQIIRSAGSIGANYIEANEALSKKDFLMRIKISRKEAKECIYWFKIIEIENPDFQQEQADLLKEATELMKIFGSILQKSK
jgi:four helix bundle protein